MARTYSHIPEPRFVQKAGEAEGGGSGLPAVTSADNGKMLQVTNGEWRVKGYPINDDIVTIFSNTYIMPENGDVNIYDIPYDVNYNEWTVKVNGVALTYSEDFRYFVSDEEETMGFADADDSYYQFWVTDAGTYELNITKESVTMDENFVTGVKAVIPSEIITFTYDGDIQGYISNKSTKYVFDLLSEGHLFLAKVYRGSETTYSLGNVFAEIDNTNIGALHIPDIGQYINTYPTVISTSDFNWIIAT